MATITYRVDHDRVGAELNERQRATRRRFIGPAKWLVLLGVVFGVLCVVVDSLSLRILFGVLSGFLLLGTGGAIGLATKLPKTDPTDYTLELDEDSLAFEWVGRHRVPWSAVSDIETKGGHITFRVSKDLLPAPLNLLKGMRHLASVFGIPLNDPLVVISDIYNTSLDEIAATLNEYRERALGGGDEVGGPQAPEPA